MNSIVSGRCWEGDERGDGSNFPGSQWMGGSLERDHSIIHSFVLLRKEGRGT